MNTDEYYIRGLRGIRAKFLRFHRKKSGKYLVVWNIIRIFVAYLG